MRPHITVKFDANGGTGTMANQEIPFNTSTNLSTNTFSKSGEMFAGWNTNADGSGMHYGDGQSVINLEDVTLYAQWGIKEGYTIYYNPSGTYNLQREYSTSDSTTSITLNSSTGESFNITTWKVLSVSGTNIQMVPCTPTTGKVLLKKAQGYNNGVYLLNQICSNLYKNDVKGITARSINMDDIEGIINKIGTYALPTPTQLSGTYDSGDSKYYPVIYGQEKLNTVSPSTRILDLSEQTRLIERSEATSTTSSIGLITTLSSLTIPYNTYYELDNSNFSTALGSTYTGILLPIGSSTNYFVASRCVSPESDMCKYIIRGVYNGSLKYGMYTTLHNGDISSGTSSGSSLFPVVSLNSSILETDTEHGTNYKVK